MGGRPLGPNHRLLPYPPGVGPADVFRNARDLGLLDLVVAAAEELMLPEHLVVPELWQALVRPRPEPGRLVRLPFDADGPDLDAVADALGLEVRAVVQLLTGRPLQVAFLGFLPGFAYLVGLDERLRRLPRRSAPRAQVPAGSVAVGGGYAGVYPVSSPGGWHLLGRTDPALVAPGVLEPGDTVLLLPTA